MIAALSTPLSVCARIAAIVRERGMNAAELSRLTQIQRNLVNKILTDPAHQIRNGTVKRIADALGLTVYQLVDAPLEEVLRLPTPSKVQAYERAMQVEVERWIEDHPDELAGLTRSLIV